MIHLDIKTGYSFLKAYGSPSQFFDRSQATQSPGFGIADMHSTWGHISFWKEGKKRKQKVLLGVQIPVVKELDKKNLFDLVTIIAKDNVGLKAQYEALTKATAQFYYRPRITWDQLIDVSDNNYIIANQIAADNYAEFSRVPGGIIGADPSLPFLLSKAKARSNRVAIATSPLYPTAADAEAYRLALSIGSARKLGDIDRSDRWFLNKGECKSRYLAAGIEEKLFDQWYEYNEEIFESCNAAPEEAKNIKPDINITIEEWCQTGAKSRGIDLDAEPYKSRLKYEIELVKSKGFVDYFLLIADLIQWAKETMLVGPARGSSAGSLVCYLMGIVEVDPIQHNLMFERFIDVTRVDLPDIDIDFPDDKRDSIFDYLGSRYGNEKIARLGTISVFKSKSALNDVGKSCSIPKWKIDDLSSVLIDRSGGDARANLTIMDTIQQFDKARELVREYPQIRLAEKIEGHPRHSGTHAAGVCISNDDISKYCSVDHYRGSIGMLTKYDAESIGLMKIDALGLKTLSVIEDCCEMVGVNFRHLYNIPLDHAPAYELFNQDRVAGIFQFEGYAVRSLMRQMGVEHFGDITALTALARPGPLHCGSANEFIQRRVGNKDWNYEHPSMVDHTKDTYGTIVYQEQVMSITKDLGGMDWQDVNTLRRAMSKSLGEEFFNQYRDKFLIGTKSKGIEDDTAISIWNDMCTFGSWAFNLSHAVSYAYVSYWCAYLKSKYPLEFAVAHLRRAATDDASFRILRELDKEGYEIIPFDPEVSEISWSAKEGKIIGGYNSVKGIGDKSANAIVSKRKANPSGWKDDLALAQRAKVFAPNNTPWHNLKRLQSTYAALYNDPNNFKSEALPNGVSSKIVKIEDIPEERGEYVFIATLKQRNLRDLNETQSLAKRNGRLIHYQNLFLNLQVEDDTGSILAQVNRFRYQNIGKPLMEEASDGEDFIIRGQIRETGKRKVDIINMVKIS